MKVFVTFSS